MQKLGESDRIITLLTRRHGRVRAVARGVRRTTSRFGARLEPFGHVDVQLAGDLGTAPARPCTRSARSRASSCTASASSRTTRATRPPARSPRPPSGSRRSSRSRRCGCSSSPSARCKALAGGEHAGTLVLDAYLLRAMALAGWAPALTECAVCGTPGPHRAFSVPAGGVVCPDCRPPGAAHPAAGHPRPDGRARRRRLAGRRRRDAGPRRECSGLVAAHLQWHLERGLRSLPLVDRRRRGEHSDQRPAARTAARRTRPAPGRRRCRRRACRSTSRS